MICQQSDVVREDGDGVDATALVTAIEAMAVVMLSVMTLTTDRSTAPTNVLDGVR